MCTIKNRLIEAILMMSDKITSHVLYGRPKYPITSGSNVIKLIKL